MMGDFFNHPKNRKGMDGHATLHSLAVEKEKYEFLMDCL